MINTPLATLNSDTAMAVKAQKAMNSAINRSDYARYDREQRMMEMAMQSPGFEWDGFKALCRIYQVRF